MTVIVRPEVNRELMEALGWLVRRRLYAAVGQLDALYEDGLQRIQASPRTHPRDDDAPAGLEIRYYLLPKFKYRITDQLRAADLVVVSFARVGRRPGHYLPRLSP